MECGSSSAWSWGCTSFICHFWQLAASVSVPLNNMQKCQALSPFFCQPFKCRIGISGQWVFFFFFFLQEIATASHYLRCCKETCWPTSDSIWGDAKNRCCKWCCSRWSRPSLTQQKHRDTLVRSILTTWKITSPIEGLDGKQRRLHWGLKSNSLRWPHRGRPSAGMVGFILNLICFLKAADWRRHSTASMPGKKCF